MADETPTTRTMKVAVDVLEDEDGRQRVRSGDLVPMRATALVPVDPLVITRLRELAARPSRRRRSGED